MLAGLLGGIAVIGYAKQPGRAQALRQAGARALVHVRRSLPQPGPLVRSGCDICERSFALTLYD
jgi:hypothetical protein